MLEILEDIGDILFGNKRQGALRHFADVKGFSYKRRVNASLLPLEAQYMGFYQKGKSRSLKGVLMKKEEELDANVFILDYQNDFGKKPTTVFLYECNRMGLPIFKISPKSTFGKLSTIWNSSEWSSVSKNFDKSYQLTSDDMNAMRMMFTFQFADVVVDMNGFTIEGNDEFLCIYKPNVEVDIVDMDFFHQSALELIDIILHDNSNELI